MKTEVNVPNVLNMKALERQVKLYDARLQELQEEVGALEKLRSACLLLLGTSADEEERSEPSEKDPLATKKSRSDLSQYLGPIFENASGPIPVSTLLEELRSSGAPLPEKKPGAAVVAALRKSEGYSEAEPGSWVRLGIPTEAAEVDASL